MQKLKEQGFTLIELLVVIAIIGVLATVMFVAIDPLAQINKSKDANVMSALNGIPAGAAVYAESVDFNYSALCTGSTTIANMVTELAGGKCNAAATAWAFEATRPSDSTFYCVDSTGTGVKSDAFTIYAATVCN